MFQALSIMLSRSRRSKFVQIPYVWLTHIDKVRGSNNQAPWATLKMTELVCCIYLYQWCYLCAEHSSVWVYQSLSSPKIRNVEDSSFVSSPFDYAFKEPMIQVCADPKCETHTQRQSARFEQPSSTSYGKDDGISLMHQSLSMMLSLWQTQFILRPSVTKFAEEKERGRIVFCFKPILSCFKGAEEPSSCRSLKWDSHSLTKCEVRTTKLHELR